MFKRKSFRGGTHPHEEKHSTEKSSIEKMPPPPKVIIPLQQHIGAPSEPIVDKGDRVLLGQPLSRTDKYVSVPVHASVSGTVVQIEKRPHPLGLELPAVEIESDGKDEAVETIRFDEDFLNLSADDMKKRIQEAGIAGMGGAAFPTHVKLSPPPEKPIEIFLLNGAECEPYLTADHRLMLERTDEILKGIDIIRKILNTRRTLVAIEKNKPDAIRLWKEKAKNRNIEIVALAVKYPQGAEKQLIKSATGREVPSGGLPMDVGCLVHNVGTAIAVYEAVAMNKPVIERVLTVTGPGVIRPANVLARIGTPFRDLIAFCGGYAPGACKLVNGGPMMGISQFTDEVPVIKGTSGILVLDKRSQSVPEKSCIGCARCVDVCPMHLVPTQIAAFVEAGNIDQAKRLGLLDCMECGSCSYICPSKRNLVHYIKLGKLVWNEKRKPVA